MRLKDHKRLVIGAQRLIRKAAELGIIDLTNGIYPADFSGTNPEVLQVRDQHYLKLLGQVAVLAVKAGNYDFAQEVSTFAASVRKGGVKRI